jgi:phage terminase Nu1 subunit (DNA packaging protein)
MAGRKGKGQIVSRQGLAEFFGVALPTVDHWVRIGMPVVTRGGVGKKWEFNTAAVAGWREDQARENATGSAPNDATELKLRQLAAKTAQAELELARAKAEVAPVDQMRRAMQSAFAEVKANIRNVPSRAVRMLIGETDEVRFKRVLLEEIDQALEALAEADLIDEDAIDDMEGGDEDD